MSDLTITVKGSSWARVTQERDSLQDQRDFAMSEMERLKRERNRWKADCLEQCKLLAMSADREEKLLQQVAALKSQVSNLQFS